jgi:hypothetical protein
VTNVIQQEQNKWMEAANAIQVTLKSTKLNVKFNATYPV